jgi:hypothetical protein
MTERRLVALVFALILLLHGSGIAAAGLTGATARSVGPLPTAAAPPQVSHSSSWVALSSIAR